jgi:hypothetical protein
MNNFKRRQPLNSRPQAMDGFFSRPNNVSGGTNLRPRVRQRSYAPATPAMQPLRRPVSDFRRPATSEAPVRRSLQTNQRPRRSAYANTLATNLNMELPEAGRRTRKKFAKGSKLQKIRKWTFRTAAVSMIMVLAVGGLLFGKDHTREVT